MDLLQLDIKSMMLMCFFIGVIISGGLCIILTDRYVCPGMYHWGAGFVCFTLGLFFAVSRVIIPIEISIFFGMTFSLLTPCLLWLGLLAYNGRIKKWNHIILLMSPLMGMGMLTMYHSDVPEIVRAKAMMFLLMPLSLVCIREALRERTRYESGRFMFAFTLCLIMAGSVGRLFTLESAASYGLLESNISNAIMIFNTTTALLGLSFSILMINSQWLQQKLAVFASYDALTGIYNRHGFNEQIAVLFGASSGRVTASDSCSIAMIDIDYFKKTNDSYGHHVGDVVLKEVAIRLKQNIRYNDILARYGGEEFIVILPAANQVEALSWAERVCKQIAEQPVFVDEIKINITISIGMAAFIHVANHSLDDAIKKADIALYQAKDSGRNRVCFFAGE
jgi:diguanylate cyclase (GGDEF)-like protein